jgi:Fe2+ or Zn2+ uptake regulation protein
MGHCEELVHAFRQHGYKITSQRRAILQVLADSVCHLTAEQIHERVLRHAPDISLATVYNTLRELVAIGQLYELDLGLGMRCYEIERKQHAHLVCSRCGQIKDVAGDTEKLASIFPVTDGFCVTRYCLVIYGYCSDCMQSKAGPT